jgi:hypothetical protein
MSIGGPRRPLEVSEGVAATTQDKVRSAILVEGWSDEAAVQAWAQTSGLDLADNGIIVLAVGGITNLGKFAAALRESAPGVRLCGLYDASEEVVALRSLERAGLVANLTREAAATLGFFACDNDLEDELIRALGPIAVERILESEGEMPSFRRFQIQPAQRGWDAHRLLKRFMGTRAGRKVRYGSLLVQALAPEDVPAPLKRALEFAAEGSARFQI